MSTTEKQFDPKGILIAALLTEKAKLLLELPNAAPAQSGAIREEIAIGLST